MKVKIFVFALLYLLPFSLIGQTDSVIANAYVKRSEVLLHNSYSDRSLEIFNKALVYMDSVPDKRVAKLGALLHFEKEKYVEARAYAKQYFELEKDETDEDYQSMLVTFDNIQDKIENQIAEQKSKEIQLLWADVDVKRLDSLNNIWTKKSKDYTIKIDSIYEFNKHNITVFSKNGRLGIIDDIGNILKKPSNYIHFITYDGYILMLDKETNPTEIFAFSCETKQGVLLPSVASFNATSTHFGKVMLPRANGWIVTYPNNSIKAYVYNLKEDSFMMIGNLNEFLVKLKKNNIIEKYKDEHLFIEERWLTLGSHFGAGVYELYEANKKFGYLNTSNGLFWDANYYEYLGGFYNDNFESIESNERFWLDADGSSRAFNENENGSYKGASRFTKYDDGIYIILQEREGKDYLIFGENALLNQKHYIEEALD